MKTADGSAHHKVLIGARELPQFYHRADQHEVSLAPPNPPGPRTNKSYSARTREERAARTGMEAPGEEEGTGQPGAGRGRPRTARPQLRAARGRAAAPRAQVTPHRGEKGEAAVDPRPAVTRGHVRPPLRKAEQRSPPGPTRGGAAPKAGTGGRPDPRGRSAPNPTARGAGRWAPPQRAAEEGRQPRGPRGPHPRGRAVREPRALPRGCTTPSVASLRLALPARWGRGAAGDGRPRLPVCSASPALLLPGAVRTAGRPVRAATRSAARGTGSNRRFSAPAPPRRHVTARASQWGACGGTADEPRGGEVAPADKSAAAPGPPLAAHLRPARYGGPRPGPPRAAPVVRSGLRRPHGAEAAWERWEARLEARLEPGRWRGGCRSPSVQITEEVKVGGERGEKTTVAGRDH